MTRPTSVLLLSTLLVLAAACRAHNPATLTTAPPQEPTPARSDEAEADDRAPALPPLSSDHTGRASAGSAPAPLDDVHRCTSNPAREAPVVLGSLGPGSRFIELLNNGGVELQARIVAPDGTPPMAGTIRVPAGGSGRFMVEQGTWHLRYRDQSSCAVFEGTPIFIGSEHAGVQVSITAIFLQGEHHSAREVEQEL